MAALITNLIRFSWAVLIFGICSKCKATECNIGTPLQCDCSAINTNFEATTKTPQFHSSIEQSALEIVQHSPKCGSLFQPPSTLHAVSVLFNGCHASLNEHTLKMKIAGWLMEECTMAHDCKLKAPLTADNVLFVTAVCSPNHESGFTLFVSTNTTLNLRGYLDTEYLLPSLLVLTILKTRTVFLEVEYGAHLTGIRATPFRAYEPPKQAVLDEINQSIEINIHSEGGDQYLRNTTLLREDPPFHRSPAFIVICIFVVYVAIVWMIACLRLQCIRDRLFAKKYMAAPLILDERVADGFALDAHLAENSSNTGSFTPSNHYSTHPLPQFHTAHNPQLRTDKMNNSNGTSSINSPDSNENAVAYYRPN